MSSKGTNYLGVSTGSIMTSVLSLLRGSRNSIIFLTLDWDLISVFPLSTTRRMAFDSGLEDRLAVELL